jgi:hypothetical protein
MSGESSEKVIPMTCIRLPIASTTRRTGLSRVLQVKAMKGRMQKTQSAVRNIIVEERACRLPINGSAVLFADLAKYHQAGDEAFLKHCKLTQ